jgi:hypothetical protein
VADSNFPAQFAVKKIESLFTPFQLLSLSPQTEKVVKMFWVFHLVSSRKLTENTEINFSNQ